MGFKGNTHVVIPHNRMELLKGDVVFDEMASWYSPLKVAKDGEARNGDVSSNVEQDHN